MKKIGIAVTDPDDWTVVALCNAVKHYDMLPVKFSFNDATSNVSSGKIFADKVDLTALDAVVVRDLGPCTQGDISFRFDTLCQIKELGIEIINSPDSIAKAANKYVSSYLFQKNGIPTPETVVTNNLNKALEALSSFGCAVVKPVFGYKGIGVERLKNNNSSAQRLKELLKKNNLLYIQEFIPSPGRDIRVFVVDKRVTGSIYRIASPGKWINNLSLGGSTASCLLTGEQERLSLKAAEVIGTVYAGVDIIEGDRDYVIEINGTPSGKGIYEASRIDVAMKIAEYVFNLI